MERDLEVEDEELPVIEPTTRAPGSSEPVRSQ